MRLRYTLLGFTLSIAAVFLYSMFMEFRAMQGTVDQLVKYAVSQQKAQADASGGAPTPPKP